MIYLSYIVKIGIYILFALIPFFCSSSNNRNDPLYCCKHPSCKSKKIGYFSILFYSLLFGFYSIICSTLSSTMDRGHYIRTFTTDSTGTWSLGLRAIGDILHLFTYDSNILFFTVTFFCTFLTLFAYRLSTTTNREVLLFWTFSMSIVNSFYLLKQAPSVALGEVSIILFMKRKYFSSAAFFILAVLFHESALVLLPLYVAMLLSSKQWQRWMIYPLVFICVFFFAPVSRIAVQFFVEIYPDLFKQISGYLDETGAITSASNLVTVLKGLPYYLITLYGFINRKSLKNEISNYDQYLMLSACATGLYLLSSYMYWMWRFAAYCFFPMYLFASELYQKKKNRRSAQLFLWGVLASLMFFTLRYLYQIYFYYGGF